jgi:hypothetical protein
MCERISAFACSRLISAGVTSDYQHHGLVLRDRLVVLLDEQAGLRRLEAHLRRADADDVALFERVLGDLLLVDERSVGAVEVDDREAGRQLPDDGMKARRAAVMQDEIDERGDAADPRLTRLQLVNRLLPAARDD